MMDGLVLSHQPAELGDAEPRLQGAVNGRAQQGGPVVFVSKDLAARIKADALGIRTEDFVPRPDRNEVLEGTIHGRRYYQLDFTPEQYRSLALLCATLHEVFPRIRLEAPRDADGAVRTT